MMASETVYHSFLVRENRDETAWLTFSQRSRDVSSTMVWYTVAVSIRDRNDQKKGEEDEREKDDSTLDGDAE